MAVPTAARPPVAAAAVAAVSSPAGTGSFVMLHPPVAAASPPATAAASTSSPPPRLPSTGPLLPPYQPSPQSSPISSPRALRKALDVLATDVSKKVRRRPSVPPTTSVDRSAARSASSCCGKGGAGAAVTLYERLFSTASVTTMEAKYTTSSFIAEFWCTLTSPFFALPLLIYFFVPASAVPPLQHACIAGSCLAALVSTLYHSTLWKVFSSADAAVATVTFYLNAISLNRHGHYSHPLLHHEITWLLTVVIIFAVFIYHWEKTHHLSLTLVLLCSPPAVFGFYALESYVGLGTGVTGLICFAVDRRGVASLHSVWHVLGGLSLLWGIWDACLAAERVKAVGLATAAVLLR
ncbi:hypothetical protein HDU87_007476 [Geranomyces variabilis]|uniref:Uncharacterized protein n=1 Tax=Geranomyces variabilis TaxID=109894 RepID=A0AAD5TPE7_9FUNG|nr:hypothetical protein HDU87_007476 [Geranomyces variabilis]